jgi:ABC-type glycerol-3-phosphate transport system substrate-binding protein
VHVRSVRDFVFGGVTGLLVGVLLAVSVLHVVRTGDPQELEPGALTVLSGRDDSAGGQRQQLIDIWNDSHPHNPARILQIDQAASGVYSEMIAQARNPDIDVFNLDVTLTAAFADPASGDPWIVPIDRRWLAEKPEQAFMAKPLSTCRYEGRLWALPFNTDAGLLYYRTGLGIEPPVTWTTIRSAAARHPEFPAAYTAQLGEYEGLTVNVLEAVWANGADLTIAENGQVTLDLAKWNAAVRLLLPRNSKDGLVHPDALNSEENGSTSTFQDGSVMFMRNWPVAYRTLKNADKKLGFDVTSLPGPSVLGGQNLAVSARSKKPRAAQALVEFLTGRRSQNILFDRGGFAATRADIYADETIKSDHPYASLLHTAIDGARLRPVSPNYVAFSEMLSSQVHAVLDGELPALPPDFADSLTAALRGK